MTTLGLNALPNLPARARREAVASSLAAVASRIALNTFEDHIPEAGHHIDVSSLAILLHNNPKLIERLKDESGRVQRSRWSHVDQLAKVLEERGEGAAAQSMSMCNNPDHVHYLISEDGQMVKARRRSCWQRVCPHCAKVIAQRYKVRYEKRIISVIGQKVAGFSLKKIETTIRPSWSITDLPGERRTKEANDYKDLHRCTKLFYKKLFAGDKRAGAFATCERGSEGNKLHTHSIAYTKYKSQKQLSDLWRKITRKHRAIYQDEVKQVTERMKANGAPRAAIRAAVNEIGDCIVWVRRVTPGEAITEGIKYITKLSRRVGSEANEFELSVEQIADLHMLLKGKRRIWSWGAFYGIDDDLTKEEKQEQEDKAIDNAPKFYIVGHVEVRAALLHLTRKNNCLVSPKMGDVLIISSAMSPPCSPM